MYADYVPGVQGGNMNYGHVVEGQLFGYLPLTFVLIRFDPKGRPSCLDCFDFFVSFIVRFTLKCTI